MNDELANASLTEPLVGVTVFFFCMLGLFLVLSRANPPLQSSHRNDWPKTSTFGFSRDLKVGDPVRITWAYKGMFYEPCGTWKVFRGRVTEITDTHYPQGLVVISFNNGSEHRLTFEEANRGCSEVGELPWHSYSRYYYSF